MSRPIPTFPRGPRRRRSATDVETVLLGCPRISPEWELAAVTALMRPKPTTRGVVEHRDGRQLWPADADGRVTALADAVNDRLGTEIGLHCSSAGEYHAVAAVPAEFEPHGRALAVVLSRSLPDLWFVYGRLFVRDGQFHRRRRGYQMGLVGATDVHLARDVRAKLRGLL